jgi:hypothetical protein
LVIRRFYAISIADIGFQIDDLENLKNATIVKKIRNPQ